jgi:hypothetical protein
MENQIGKIATYTVFHCENKEWVYVIILTEILRYTMKENCISSSLHPKGS